MSGRSRAGPRRGLRLALAAAALLMAAAGRAASAAPEPDSEVIVLDPEAPPARAGGRAPAPAEERQRSIENSELRIQAMWFARKAYLERNQLERAAEQLRAMQEFRRQEGISNLDTLAGAFSYEGFRQLEAGQYGAAHASFRLAKEFDPDLPNAYYGQARSLRGLRMGWTASLKEAWEGMQVALRNFWSAYLLLGNLALIGLIAAGIAGVLFLIILALKYQPLVRHDLAEWLGRRLPESTAGLAAWALFLLPLMAGLGWMWVLLLWTVAVFPYARWTERLLASLVMVWAVAALPLFHVVGEMFQTSVNPEVRTLVSALRGGYDPEKIRFLSEAAGHGQHSAVTEFLLGSLYKNGGYLNEALLHYKKAVSLNPRLYQAVNNLGNLYFLTQNFSLAQQQYQQAVDLQPDFATGYFNLHLAQYQQFHVEDAERNLETARHLDPEGLGRLRTQELLTSVVDARLQLEEVWPAIAARSRSGRASGDLTGDWLTPYSAVAGFALVASHGVFAHRRRRRARRCFKCGRPFCSRCRSGTQFPDFCSQCVHLFIKRDGLAPSTKRAKLDEVRRFETNRRRLGRLLSLAAPGVGHVWGDRATFGFMSLSAWSFCLLTMLAHDRLLRFYEVAYANARPAAGLVAALGAALVWLVANLVPPVRRR
jgi:tetratricopeptide (TPR) repeat protein